MSTSLRHIIESAASTSGCSLGDLTVLSASRDAYRLDTPAGHAKGQWLAEAYREVNPEGRRLHLRGLHYRLVGRVNLPNGKPYINDDATWTWMSEQAAKCARFLGYLPWDALRDARNAPPQVFTPYFSKPYWNISVEGVYVSLPENLLPKMKLHGDLYRQPWRQVIIAEKQGVSDLLKPIAQSYQASLVLPGGELSDQILYEVLEEADRDGRPLAIHQLGDFDPAGHQMAISTARTAQAIRDQWFPDLEIRVHAIALTLEQCRKWQLPSTPLKETERRASKWTAAMGWEQTELDAAVALVPREFGQVIRDSLLQYYDRDLVDKARQERDRLEEEANARLAEQLGDDAMSEIRFNAQGKLEELDELVDQINEALHFDPAEAGIVMPEAPEVMIGDTQLRDLPLFDSANDWATSTMRLIQRKRYAENGEVMEAAHD